MKKAFKILFVVFAMLVLAGPKKKTVIGLIHADLLQTTVHVPYAELVFDEIADEELRSNGKALFLMSPFVSAYFSFNSYIPSRFAAFPAFTAPGKSPAQLCVFRL